jgi:hypothetical protein
MLGLALVACGRTNEDAPRPDSVSQTANTPGALEEDEDTPGPATDAANDLTEKGTRDLKVGKPAFQARAVTGPFLPPAGADSLRCRMVTWEAAPPGVRLMLENNMLVRIDVDSGPVTTRDGAKVGDPESRILELYSGRVDVAPHKYSDGWHYLTVRPVAPADSFFRFVFETDGKVVRSFRAGQRPQVEYVERCG